MGKVMQYKDIDTALRIYYQHTELSNSDFRELFPGISQTTLARWKKEIHKMEVEGGVHRSQSRVVNTKVAYKFLGLDVDDLEKRRAKLIKLGLMPEPEAM